MAKRLTRINIAHEYFDNEGLYCCKRVAQGDRVMGQCPRINYDTICFICMLLEIIDKPTFVIRLAALHGCSQLCATFLQHCIDVCQGCCAIDSGFASPQRIEVWAVHDNYF